MNDESTSTMTVGAAPGKVPVLGHLLTLGLHPLEFMASLPASGDLVEIKFGRRQAFAVCHPELVHQVLRDGRTYDKGGPLWDQVRYALGNGLALCDYQVHKRQRQLVQSSFAPNRMPGYANLMGEQITAAMESWQDGQTLDVHTALNGIAVRVLTQALFATSLPPADVAQARRAVDAVIKGVFWRMVTPAHLRWLPVPAIRRVNSAVALLDELVERIIKIYRQDVADRGDMLSTLIAARDEHGDSLADKEIRDQVLIFIVGGSESIPALLGWVLHLMATHPEVEERVHAEIDTVLDGSLATHDDIPRLEYTGRVLTETLRLYPSAWMFTRIVTADTHLGGRALPAGTTLVISPYQMHHRGDYFVDPERFDPDRWLPENAPTLPRGAYIPFGAGPRRCIGDAYGMHEVTLALAGIAARWRLASVPGVRVRSHTRAIVRPHPLLMRLEQRHRR